MESRLAEYLRRIRFAAESAGRSVKGLEFGDFIADEKTQQAVAMSLFIVGETVTKIIERFPEFAMAHSDSPVAIDARDAQPNRA